MSLKPKRRLTIAMLAAELDDDYQTAIWKGIESRAAQFDIGVLSILGSRIESPIGFEATANTIYSLADSHQIDGVVVLTAAISTFIDTHKVLKFLQNPLGIPRVSLGLKVPGIPSLVVDGARGIEDLVKHLVLGHGRRRMAIISGPAGHGEAEERKISLLTALKSFGVVPDPRLIVPGSFLQGSGVEGVKTLLNQQIPFDSLFCMNDRTAIGAIEELQRSGVKVPQEVAVVGFDDIEEGTYLTPPLTSVRQPLFELGVSAVDILYDILQARDLVGHHLLCHAVIRESCGCLPRQSFSPENHVKWEDISKLDRHLVEELLRLAISGNDHLFLKRLNQNLLDSVVQRRSLERWQDYLTAIRSKLREEESWDLVFDEFLFESARDLIAKAETRSQAERRIQASRRYATLRSIGSSLIAAFEMNSMIRELAKGLHALGFYRGFLVRVDGKDIPNGWSRLWMSLDDSQILPNKPIRFHSNDILPPDILWRQECWVLEPLVFQDEILGYMVLPGGLIDASTYDSIKESVASAMASLLLLEKVQTHERRLELDVARRTQELTRANQELVKEVDRRKFLEQEVTQISNRTMESIGQDLHDDLCQHLAGILLMFSAVKSSGRLTSDSPEVLDRIQTLLSDSIVRVKQIARGLLPMGFEEQGLLGALEALVISARHSSNVEITLEADSEFSLDDKDRALQIYRILQEALQNSVKHSRSPKIEVKLYANVRIKTIKRKKTALPGWIAEVRDYGCGIPAKVGGDGMGMRIMRYRAEKACAVLNLESMNPGTKVSCWFAESSGGDIC